MPPTLQFVIPGPLERRTGGTVYDRRIIEELRRTGHEVVVHALAGRFPDTDETAIAAGAAALDAIPEDAVVVVDGLAMPAVADQWTQRASGSARLVVLCHHPLAAETGLAASDRTRLFAIERAGLALADRVVVPSRHTGSALAEYRVAPDRIRVVPPGLDPLPADQPPTGYVRPASPTRLICVANLTPRKGHDILLDALGRVDDLDWTLTLVGAATMDPATADAVHRAGAGFDGRVELTGELDDAQLAVAYRAADVFVLASRYEGYGMVFAEAMQYGLPVVGTTAGAIPDVVPPRAGLLVAPDDAGALAAALRRILTDPVLYRSLSEGGRIHSRELPSWAESARLFERALAGDG